MALSLRIRYQILERDGFSCRYCGAFGKGVELQVDHVVPQSRGGGDDPWNLTAACQKCNAGKTDRMPPDEIIRAVYADHLGHSHDPNYQPCMGCGKPTGVSGHEDWAPDTGYWVDCPTCNDIRSSAFDAGAGVIYHGSGGR